VIVTNPPYRGSNDLNGKLVNYLKKTYPDSKSDLFATFIERYEVFTKANSYQAMITQHAWMFLSSYEKLRTKLQHRDIVNMAHLGARAFPEIGGEVVQATAFVMRTSHIKGFKGVYIRLVDIDNADGKEQEFLSENHRYTADSDNFAKIPGSPVAYWVSDKILSAFAEKHLDDYADCCTGMQTGDNDKYVRTWYEVNFCRTAICVENGEYKRYNCGGESRKWYGNHINVVKWGDNGASIKAEKGSVIRNESFYYVIYRNDTFQLKTNADNKYTKNIPQKRGMFLHISLKN
jgi:hypothetical protein